MNEAGEGTPMPLDHLKQRLGAVAVQMEAISDLDSLWGAAAYTISVGARAFTRDDLGAGMMVQPGR